MSERSRKYYDDWKKHTEKGKKEYKDLDLNKKRASKQETKPVKTHSPTSYMGSESKKEYTRSTQQHPKKLLSRIKFFTIGFLQKITCEVYFLKGKGLLGFVLFAGESIVCFVLLAAGIGLYILPLCFVLSILLIWVGFEIGGYIALVGLLIMVLGAFLSTILHFAQMNVRLYKEEHFREVNNLEAEE